MANPFLGGGAIAVGQAPGPVALPITGSVTRTVIADNGPDVQIYEADCDLASWSTITYTSNTMHGSATPYYRSCNGASASVAAFNDLTGKASGNVSAAATFARFLAAPGTILAGSTSVLAWSVPGASSLTVDGGVGTVGGPSQTRDVTPGATTTYALAQGMTPRGTATVTVATTTTTTSEAPTTTSTILPQTSTTTTTSTTLPAGCGTPSVSFASLICRLDALLASVQAAPDLGTTKAALVNGVTAARTKTQSAEASANAGSTRPANNALKKAARKMIDFGHRLRSLRSRKKIPAATRSGLLTQSQPILDDLKALRKQL
jgi:hypothetical protein